MMQKRLLSLLLITVAVLGIGLILTQRQQPIVEGVSESGPLVPGLSNELNDIKALRITGAGNALIAELTRKDSGWVVSNRHDYPADFDKVREYLLKLADAKLREAKTSKPENYARLGVEDLAGAEAKGLGVELIGTKAPVKLIVGIASGGGSPGSPTTVVARSIAMGRTRPSATSVYSPIRFTRPGLVAATWWGSVIRRRPASRPEGVRPRPRARPG